MIIALLMHKVVKGCLDFLLHLFQKRKTSAILGTTTITTLNNIKNIS